MQPENLTEVLKKHPFLETLDDKYVDTLLSCATNVVFNEGDHLFSDVCFP